MGPAGCLSQLYSQTPPASPASDRPILAGSFPAQVTTGVTGSPGEGPARAGDAAGRALGAGRWALALSTRRPVLRRGARTARLEEAPAQLRKARARTKGCSVPRGASAGGCRGAPARGRVGQVGAARSGEGPQCPRCGEVASRTAGGGDLPLAAAAGGPGTARSAWQGQARPHAGRPQPPAAPGMQQTEPVGWGGPRRRGGGGRGGRGAGGGRPGASARAGGRSSAAPARLSRAAGSI